MAHAYYVMIGDVRGQCGHRHHTISGLARCAQQDGHGCRSQGGYSDRLPYKIMPDGERIPLDEPDEINDYDRLRFGD